jgi:hypothetical protein
MASDMSFRQFLAGTCPSYGVVSQSAVREKLQSIFQNEKLKLMEQIALAPGGVFLALARWGLESRYFVCVTAQFIDKEWNMITKIIRCRFAGVKTNSQYEYISMFSDSQSYRDMLVWYDDDMGEHAEDIVNEVVKDWSLEGKLLGISLPKSLVNQDLSGLQKNLAEQNYLLVKYKILSLPCIIESLHDLFDCLKTKSIQKISEDWFKYMTCSQLSMERYNKILSRLQIKRPSFGSQKWHLTFYILEVALQFNRKFPNPTPSDLLYYPFKPSNEKLEAAENFCSLTRLIYNAILVISSPSSGMNSHIHKILSLKHDLKSSCRKRNMNQVFDLETMNKKFDEIWRNWYLWLCLAVILDPRYKFRFLTRSLGEAFGIDATRYMIEVRAKIYELFIRYSFLADQQSCELSNERKIDSQVAAHEHGSVSVHDTIQNFSDQSVHEKLGELIQYLEGECIPEYVPFDILKWWKDNASTYPTLARLAQDILAIPVSGVSNESALDVTDERASLFNRKMSPEQVEALICTQDWIKSSGKTLSFLFRCAAELTLGRTKGLVSMMFLFLVNRNK